jgi:ATP-dependent RNA helicase DDX47/RRP3
MKPVRDPDVRTACETYTDFVHQPLDRLLDLDFGPVLDKIIKVLPRDGRHTYLFSATMSSKVESLQRAALQNPVRVSISSSSHQVVSTLQQRYIFRKFHVQDT